MKILGIDQSANQNGICHAKFVNGFPVNYQAKIHKLKLKGNPRLKEFADWFLEEAKYGPDLVVMEQRISYGSTNERAGGTMVIHEIAGVLKYLCILNGFPLLCIWPVQLKQWATGKGNAKKPDMVAKATEELGIVIPKTHDDLADAYFLAQIGVFKKLNNTLDDEVKTRILRESTVQ